MQRRAQVETPHSRKEAANTQPDTKTQQNLGFVCKLYFWPSSVHLEGSDCSNQHSTVWNKTLTEIEARETVVRTLLRHNIANDSTANVHEQTGTAHSCMAVSFARFLCGLTTVTISINDYTISLM